MNQIWFEVFAAMIVASIIKNLFFNMFIWVGIDVALLGVCYLILRRWRYYVDMKKSMMFLAGLTLVNVLTDLGIISMLISNLLFLALLAWMMFGGSGGGSKRSTPRYKWHK